MHKLLARTIDAEAAEDKLDKLKQAWEVLSFEKSCQNPNNFTDLKVLLDNLGISQACHLNFATLSQINQMCDFLKAVPRQTVLALLV